MLDARAHFIANIIIVIAILQTLVSLTVCLCVAGREKKWWIDIATAHLLALL